MAIRLRHAGWFALGFFSTDTSIVVMLLVQVPSQQLPGGGAFGQALSFQWIMAQRSFTEPISRKRKPSVNVGTCICMVLVLSVAPEGHCQQAVRVVLLIVITKEILETAGSMAVSRHDTLRFFSRSPLLPL